MNNIFDALEVCLQEIENGADMETVLARYPKLANELRPILETSVKARNMSNVEPSPDAIRRGRARVMQHAAELRESRVAPRKRVIPAFQRLALSFSLAALLLLSSTGLLNASASALPGENLYPVKRTWEGLRLLLIFDQQARTLLEDQFEYERLHEVNELLTEGRHETIQFAGVFMQVNGVTYVSGVPVILPASIQLPDSGTAVILTGQTNAQGVVEIITIDALPDGSVVPVGNPIEMELESESNSNDSGSSNNSNNNEAPVAVPQNYAMEGTLQAISSTTLVVNDLTVYPDNAKIEGELCVGARVEVEGYFAGDGRFIVTKVEAKGSCSADGVNNNNENSNGDSSGSNNNSNDNHDDGNNNNESNDNGDDHSNDNGDDHSSGDDNGGDASSGSGGDDSGSGGSGGGGDDDD